MGVVNPKALLKDFLLYVKHELWVPEHHVHRAVEVLGEGQDGRKRAKRRFSNELFAAP